MVVEGLEDGKRTLRHRSPCRQRWRGGQRERGCWDGDAWRRRRRHPQEAVELVALFGVVYVTQGHDRVR